MGSGIACQLANVGLEILMLDILPQHDQKDAGHQPGPWGTGRSSRHHGRATDDQSRLVPQDGLPGDPVAEQGARHESAVPYLPAAAETVGHNVERCAG